MASEFRHDYWEIGRTRLHVLVYPNNGPTTLFLHANGMSAGTYIPLYRHLSHHLHLITADLPGHGRSGPPATVPVRSWHSLVPDLQQFIARHFQPPINVVGHSLGAVTAYLTAARFPGLIKRLVMIDPVILPRPMLWGYALMGRMGLMGQLPLVKATRRRKYLFNSRQEAYRRFMSRKGMFKTWDKAFIQAYLADALDFSQSPGRLRCHPEIEAQIFSSIPIDAWTHASKIKCPVLLLRGEKSDTFYKAAADRLSKKIQTCRLQTIAGTTHFLPMEKPPVVASHIVSVFKEGVR